MLLVIYITMLRKVLNLFGRGAFMGKLVVVGRIVDGTGREPFNGFVVIEDKKIVQVSKEEELKTLSVENAETIKIENGTILPGLIDCHVHLTGSRTLDFLKASLEPVAAKAARLVGDLAQLIDAGFTTVRDVGGLGIYLKKVIEEGEIKGPRILAAGKLLSQTGGHGDFHSLPLEWAKEGDFTRLCDGVSECIKAVREQFREDADFIKICTTGGVLSQRDLPTSSQFNLDEIKAMVEEAKSVGSYVAAHAEGTQGIKNALIAGVRTIEHGDLIDDEGIEMMAEKGVFLIPTLSIKEQISSKGEKYGIPEWGIKKLKMLQELHGDYIKKAKARGVKIAVGTDFSSKPLFPLGENSMELELLVKQEGFTPLEAIVAATKISAEAIMMDDKIGTIEPNKLADIIVVEGDPVKDITILRKAENIKLVIKDGKIEKNIL